MLSKLQKREHLKSLVQYYGADILESAVYQQSDNYIQHGNVTTLEHMISVACMCLRISRRLHLNADERTLIRGALLHDFFLYDWHAPKGVNPPHHPTRHGAYALQNAAENFSINPIEAEMIQEHMFPVTISAPHYRETYILTLADKICSTKETFSKPFYHQIIHEIKRS